MPARGTRLRLAAAGVATLAVSVSIAGCQQGGTDSNGAAAPNNHVAANGGSGNGASNEQGGSSSAPAVISTNVTDGGDVAVNTPVTVHVADGTLDDVVFTMKGTKQPLRGTYNADKTRWTANDLLEPGTTYAVASKAVNADGAMAKARSSFTTQDLSLDEQTYASVQPLQKEVVGVGMPVIVQFDIPVHNKRAFEKHMTVTATPATVGTWHWISDQEVHWRPKTFWQPGTKVHVDVDVNGVSAGHGIFGQESRHVNFTVGRSIIMKPNLANDQMKVLINGELARTIPITGGKAGFDTRSGTKLIIEKFYVKRMDSATVGIQPGSPDYYNIPDVYYAQRVTFSGEFLHSAPWSEYAQGSYNVSHGCVGMSPTNAAWLYKITHRGDPVEVTGTNRGLEENNGWTDWNESYAKYKQASALG
jgi:lipoprotein-anchoring transpeptidase ErfK/SrfK